MSRVQWPSKATFLSQTQMVTSKMLPIFIYLRSQLCWLSDPRIRGSPVLWMDQ